jgi:hypothetical protein
MSVRGDTSWRLDVFSAPCSRKPKARKGGKILKLSRKVCHFALANLCSSNHKCYISKSVNFIFSVFVAPMRRMTIVELMTLLSYHHPLSV